MSTPSTIRVRAMAAADLPAVAALSEQLGYAVRPETLEARFDHITGTTADALFTAEADGAVVGWLHVGVHHSLESDPLALIYGLVVDQRTRRSGAGRALVSRAEAWAREHGFARLRVRSNVARGEAHRFYPALGFRLVKTQHCYELALG